MHTFLVVGLLAVHLATGGGAQAQSKCDSGISKAAGKKVNCKLKEIAKAQKKATAPDPAKLAKCEEKFDKGCVKAQEIGDCAAQTQTCAAIEAEADASVATLAGSTSAPPTTSSTSTPPPTTSTTTPPQACNPLGTPGMQGCNTGEKCTWIQVQDTPAELGKLGCVPDGTVAVGGPCVHGAAGAATGYDDCVAGAVCVGRSGAATCRDICGFGGEPDSSCVAGEVCARYAGLGANGADAPVMGACGYTCDPLSQVRISGGSTVPCGAGLGCYPLQTAEDTVAVCAPAGTPTHNMPITGGATYANACAPGHIPRLAVQGVAGTECAGLCKPADVYTGSNDGVSGRPNYEGGNFIYQNWMGRPATCESAGGVTVRPEVPASGESCRYFWTRESGPLLTASSNTLGWCFNHANRRYDPDGLEPFNRTDPFPRCPATTTGDVLPPVNASMPHNDAIYFGCVQFPAGAPSPDKVETFAEEPRLDRLDGYR